MPSFDPIQDEQFTSDRVWEAFTSKYTTAGNYAVWAQSLLETNLKGIKDKLDQDDVTPALQDLLALVENIPGYTPGSTNIEYNGPDVPVYDAVPSYVAPTIDAFMDVPALSDITIPDAPSTSFSFSNAAFSDSLLTAMKAQVESDLGTGGEAAMFQRHEERVAAERAKAYTEITTQFSARGFDMPPGALLAKQTEMNNESGKRLTDVSADIMQARNQQAMTIGAQLTDLLGRLHDSKVMRDFEAAKATVQLALDAFKSVVEGLLGKANIEKTAVEAAISYNEGVVKKYLGQIEGQTAPMKAISETNQAKASAYSAGVQGATAAMQADVIPAELEIKQVGTEVEVAKVKGSILSDTAKMALDAAFRDTTTSVETMKAVALQAAQLIASSFNTVTASASLGYQASGATKYDGDIDTHDATARAAIAAKVQPPLYS